MQRKSTKNTRGANTDEKRFQAWLKTQKCCVAGQGVVEVHHCKGATFKHNKELIGHWFCIPLSQSAHRAYHSGSKTWREVYGNQCDHWHDMHYKYKNETGLSAPNSVLNAIMDYGK